MYLFFHVRPLVVSLLTERRSFQPYGMAGVDVYVYIFVYAYACVFVYVCYV